MEEKKVESVSDKLDKLYYVLKHGDGKKVKGKFKLPLHIRLFRKSLRKKNKCFIIYVRRNKGLEFKRGIIIAGMLKIEDKIYDASTKYLLNYKNTPTLVIPEWKLTPVSFSDKQDDMASEQIILKAIKTEELGITKKFGGKMIIWIIIGGIIIAYLLFGGG